VENLKLQESRFKKLGYSDSQICNFKTIREASEKLKTDLRTAKIHEHPEIYNGDPVDSYQIDIYEDKYLDNRTPRRAFETEVGDLVLNTNFPANLVKMIAKLPAVAKRKKVSHRGYALVPPALAENRGLVVFSQDKTRILGGKERRDYLQWAKDEVQLVAADVGNAILGKFVSELLREWNERGAFRNYPELEKFQRLSALNQSHRATS